VVRFDESPFERALKDFTMGPKLNVQCAEAYGNRGLVQLLRGNDAAAEADVARCWELKPGLRSVWEQRIAKTQVLRTKLTQGK